MFRWNAASVAAVFALLLSQVSNPVTAAAQQAAPTSGPITLDGVLEEPATFDTDVRMIYTRMFFNALVQYDSDNHQSTSNLRCNIIHRPLSDVYLVYHERRDERTGVLVTRAVIAKVTSLMAF